MSYFRHKKTKQVVRPIPGGKEHARIVASGRYEEVKDAPRDTSGDADDTTGERRTATATGTARIRVGGGGKK